MHENLKQEQDLTVLVLAGGQGKRMAGVDKGLQHFQGKPMIAHILDEITAHTQNVIISANRNQTVYESFGYPIYPDEMAGHWGPLAGILSGLRHCATPYMATVPCDTPFLKYDVIQQLFNTLKDQNAEIAVATTKHGDYRKMQSVFLVMKTSVINSLESYLKDGSHKISPWLNLQKAISVEFIEENLFVNINTKEELEFQETKLIKS